MKNPLLLAWIWLLVTLVGPSACQFEDTVLSTFDADNTVLKYSGDWDGVTENSVFLQYSNASDAKLTFEFTGIQVQYTASKKYDRGKFKITLDNIVTAVDLYTANTGPTEVVWESNLLKYGRHTLVMEQLQVDQRLGFYPYLISVRWGVRNPENVAAYTATETTMATSRPTASGGGAPSGGLIGGVIGGVIAAVIGVLVITWFLRKRKLQKGRGGGMPVNRISGKPIEEDDMDEFSPKGGLADNVYSTNSNHYMSVSAPIQMQQHNPPTPDLQSPIYNQHTTITPEQIPQASNSHLYPDLNPRFSGGTNYYNTSNTFQNKFNELQSPQSTIPLNPITRPDSDVYGNPGFGYLPSSDGTTLNSTNDYLLASQRTSSYSSAAPTQEVPTAFLSAPNSARPVSTVSDNSDSLPYLPTTSPPASAVPSKLARYPVAELDSEDAFMDGPPLYDADRSSQLPAALIPGGRLA